MVRVLLIVALGACASAPAPGPAAPSTALDTAAPAEGPLWDHGTFVAMTGETPDPDREERFAIRRSPDGYRFEIAWRRRQPTGELADGSITLETDDHFAPITGDDVMNVHARTVQVTRSSIRRDPDGRLATEVVAADGSKQANRSQSRNDWFIGSQFTAFLTALCQADADVTAPVVYPDKTTALSPPEPLALDGRRVTVRVLTYAASQNRVVAACEDGKLVGERAGTTSIVRSGDVALARALAAFAQ